MRIAIIGTSGSGKSTLSRTLAAALDLPHVELDAINWQPSWRNLSVDDPDEFRRRVDEATAGPGWVCDGNYGIARDLVWARATHLIWLDYERGVVMRRVLWRSLTRAMFRPDLWAGNREDWRRWLRPSHPIRWAWDTWARNRARYESALRRGEFAHLAVMRLTHPREARSVLSRLSPKGPRR